MSKGTAFIKFFDDLVEKENIVLPDDVREYYEVIKKSQDSKLNKSAFTETGLIILEFLQRCEAKTVKSKDIAENILLSSRKVSGAMRKLVNDGYVDKFGTSPVIYSITEQGKNIDLTKYKENI